MGTTLRSEKSLGSPNSRRGIFWQSKIMTTRSTAADLLRMRLFLWTTSTTVNLSRRSPICCPALLRGVIKWCLWMAQIFRKPPSLASYRIWSPPKRNICRITTSTSAGRCPMCLWVRRSTTWRKFTKPWISPSGCNSTKWWGSPANSKASIATNPKLWNSLNRYSSTTRTSPKGSPSMHFAPQCYPWSRSCPLSTQNNPLPPNTGCLSSDSPARNSTAARCLQWTSLTSLSDRSIWETIPSTQSEENSITNKTKALAQNTSPRTTLSCEEAPNPCPRANAQDFPNKITSPNRRHRKRSSNTTWTTRRGSNRCSWRNSHWKT